MRKMLWIGIFVPMVTILLTSMDSVKEPIGKITFPLNRVFVIPAGTSELSYAQFNMEVFAGDKIETKKESRCEITLRNGDIVRIDENSLYTLENVQVSENSVKAESFLGIGRLWANVKKIFTEDDYFKVKSPSAVIAVRGTIYRVNANADTTTDVLVYDGEVNVTPNSPGTDNQGAAAQPPAQKPQEVAPPQQVTGPQEVSPETWLEIVKAQQQIMVRADGSYQRSEYDPAEDAKLDWVQWNKRRDTLIDR